MSYEGYTQYICPNGHTWSADAYDEEENNCPTCNFKYERRWQVDQTNDAGVRPEFRLIEESLCPTCGHRVGAARYEFTGNMIGDTDYEEPAGDEGDPLFYALGDLVDG